MGTNSSTPWQPLKSPGTKNEGIIPGAAIYIGLAGAQENRLPAPAWPVTSAKACSRGNPWMAFWGQHGFPDGI